MHLNLKKVGCLQPKPDLTPRVRSAACASAVRNRVTLCNKNILRTSTSNSHNKTKGTNNATRRDVGSRDCVPHLRFDWTHKNVGRRGQHRAPERDSENNERDQHIAITSWDCWINLHSVDWNNNEIAPAHSTIVRYIYINNKIIILYKSRTWSVQLFLL